jgi:hypothetical protein
MISVIICSRENSISKLLRDNIQSTINFPHEIIIIDNSEDKYSIFEAYNIGIKKSIGEYFCFIHDDILFHTHNWGVVLNNIFKLDVNIGLIGVAGCKIKTRMPSGWWQCPSEFKEVNIIQHFSDKKIEKWTNGFKNGNISEVVAIDGVFMIMKKECNLFFNENLKGFHNYDLNISFECKLKKLKIVVTNEVLIEHFSYGVINNSWYKSTFDIHEIYKKILPLKLTNENIKNHSNLEFSVGEIFLYPFIRANNLKNGFKLWLKMILINPKYILENKFYKTIFKYYINKM